MILIFLLMIGLAVGSFLNVVVYRTNHPEKLKVKGKIRKFGGRSFCPQCRKKIVWYDNLPLLSYLLLKGKCRQCRSSISGQYPVVELLTALAFGGAFLFFGLPQGIGEWFSLGYHLVIVAAFLVIIVSDLLYLTIPDEALVVSGVAALVFWGFSALFQAEPLLFFIPLTAGLGAMAMFWLLHWLTKGKGMGFGDVKLAGLMGLVLGWPKIILALYLAFLTGAFFGVILILSRKKKFGQVVPFGPFLVFGTLISLFFGEKLWQVVVMVLLSSSF
ncbi:prepilin peptidase [Patescibacteria group bacterium]